MIKNLLIAFAIAVSVNGNAQVTYAASNFSLCSVINPETSVNSHGAKYSGCWGWYQADKNREYAIAGSSKGTYFVDVTNPYIPIICDFEAGKITTTIWREIKTYQNYCYVVSDDGGTNSFQIFDLKYLPDSVHKVYDSQALFRRTHAIWIDGYKLYCSSVTYSNSTYSTLDIYSLATPTAPTLIRKLNQDASFITQVHDTYANNDTVFVSAAYQGLYTFTLTPPSYSFTQVGSLTSYPFSGYNHSSAITPNKKTLVMMDEIPASLPIKIIDVQNLANMQVVSTINQTSLTTPHNPFMANDSLCFASSYNDGIQLFNIKDPTAPFLAGYFDTYPQNGANTGTYTSHYAGQWGAYPWFPSKNVFALDRQNGLFMLKTHLWANAPASETENGPLGTGVSTHTGNVTTGINEEYYKESVHFSPNPASQIVRMNVPLEFLNTILVMEIFDMNGKIVLREEHSNQNDLVSGYFMQANVSDLPEGVYMVRTNSNSGTLKKTKLIITR